MNFSAKTTAISALAGLALGFFLGFIPQHLENSKLGQSKESLQGQLAKAQAGFTRDKESLQGQLANTQSELAISAFTVRSAVVYVQAEKHNYTVAAGNASSLFTDMRSFTDQTSDNNLKQQLEHILDVRDKIIAGLAKADPAVAQQLQDLFLKMQSIRDSGN
jgi:uncharacterized membrane-anchored protein YhcB (DUF1043 family)